MSAGPSPEPGNDRPYFFLSYAHTPRHDDGSGRDPDRWVAKLYADLRDHIIAMTSVHPSEAGFMDREIRSGAPWPRRLAVALARCRVFVPLYSPRYFQSEECGKEWLAFTRRMLHHRSAHEQEVNAIIPALWVPVSDSRLPEAARSIQYKYEALGQRYASEGFYGIIKLSHYRRDYQRAAYELARLIVDVADAAGVAPGRPAEYHSLVSPFTDAASPGVKRMQITVGAPRAGELPPRRSPEYYGSTARDWNPYHPHCARPLAEHAADLVRYLGYQTTVTTLDGASGHGGETPSPGLFLVDAWLAATASGRARLRAFDAAAPAAVRPLVPWNTEDQQTAAGEGTLKPRLAQALPTMLAGGGVRGIASLEEFSDVVPPLIRKAEREFLRTAPAQPPPGPVIKKPHLEGPVTDDPGGSP